MLTEFLRANRPAIVARSTSMLLSRAVPSPTEEELRHGIPLFLDQLEARLQPDSQDVKEDATLRQSASRHGDALHRIGLTIAEVVQEYGDVCQSITELAVRQKARITPSDFQTLNLCLDEAISEAVTSYARHREDHIEGRANERISAVAHEMRTQVHTALLTFESMRTGVAPLNGSTARIHLQSLLSLQTAIDRALAEVRLDAGAVQPWPVLVRDLMEEVEISAMSEARARNQRFVVRRPDDRDLAVVGDRLTLAAALANMLQNAFAFTEAGGEVSLTACAFYDRVQFDVGDACGGLTPEKLSAMQGGTGDAAGDSHGLALIRRAAKVNRGSIHIRNVEGKGCVFTLDLARSVPA